MKEESILEKLVRSRAEAPKEQSAHSQPWGAR